MGEWDQKNFAVKIFCSVWTINNFWILISSSVEDYTVGIENCENKVGYCNGPLKPGGVYRFKIRAYTTRDQFSETHWSQQVQTDPDNTAFLVGIIIPIVLLVVVALVILGFRKMRNSKGT